MPPVVAFEPRFRRRLKRKQQRTPRLAAAVLEAVERIIRDPQNRGLNVHRLDRAAGIWEAYVTKATRLTFERDGNTIVFRNNCNHDIIDKRHW